MAWALEGIHIVGDTSELWMRAEDRQLFNPMFVATLARSGARGVIQLRKQRQRLARRRADRCRNLQHTDHVPHAITLASNSIFGWIENGDECQATASRMTKKFNLALPTPLVSAPSCNLTHPLPWPSP